jgi:hypothetical protein
MKSDLNEVFLLAFDSIQMWIVSYFFKTLPNFILDNKRRFSENDNSVI